MERGFRKSSVYSVSQWCRIDQTAASCLGNSGAYAHALQGLRQAVPAFPTSLLVPLAVFAPLRWAKQAKKCLT